MRTARVRPCADPPCCGELAATAHSPAPPLRAAEAPTAPQHHACLEMRCSHRSPSSPARARRPLLPGRGCGARHGGVREQIAFPPRSVSSACRRAAASSSGPACASPGVGGEDTVRGVRRGRAPPRAGDAPGRYLPMCAALRAPVRVARVGVAQGLRHAGDHDTTWACSSHAASTAARRDPAGRGSRSTRRSGHEAWQLIAPRGRR
jgi:hypothetical protein